MIEREIYNWVERLKGGGGGGAVSGRLSIVICFQIKDQIDQLITDKRGTSIHEVTQNFGRNVLTVTRLRRKVRTSAHSVIILSNL
jgi:hypothetical protein